MLRTTLASAAPHVGPCPRAQPVTVGPAIRLAGGHCFVSWRCLKKRKKTNLLFLKLLLFLLLCIKNVSDEKIWVSILFYHIDIHLFG
jgi:hypothetical protein